MPTVVIRHKVGNIDAWLDGHQDRVDLFSQFASGFQTFQDTDDTHSVVLVVEVVDMDAMMAVMSDAEVMEKVARDKHTVLEPITISMPADV